MKPYPFIITAMLHVILAIVLYSCPVENNSSGEGGDSTSQGQTYIDEFTATPTTDGTAVTVRWTAKPAPAGWTVTRYTITLTDNNNTDANPITVIVPFDTSAESTYSRDIVTPGGTYHVMIVAHIRDTINTENTEIITSPVDAGTVEITSQAEAPAPPPAPTVTATGSAANGQQLTVTLTVTWDAPTNPGKNSDGTDASITGYTLYWKKGAAPTITDYDDTATVQDRSYTLENLDAGTYYVAVASRNSANLQSTLSTSTAEDTAILVLYASIALGADTLTISADENISIAVADNAALLAGITVNRLPLDGVRQAANIATAATLTNNTIVITINSSAAKGDEFFINLASGLVENSAGKTNIAVELTTLVVATANFEAATLSRSTATLGSTTFVPDNHRTHFVTFGIRSGTAGAGEYRLGLKAASKTAPTVSELTNARAAITRTLAPKKINVYLPFHIEGTYFDTGVTQDYTTAASTILSANTQYSLYITPADGSGTVEKLLDITTDAVPTTTDLVMYGLPASIYEYTVREQEATILQAIVLNAVAKQADIEWLRDGTIVTTCIYDDACYPERLGMQFYVDKANNIIVINPSGVYESVNIQFKLKIKTGKFIVQPVPAE